MSNYCKRLIEVDLPIKRISAHSRREKSIRHGHISTLHIWWARRPLAACRAVVCASLWPDPADEQCPSLFIERARELMLEWTTHERQNLLSAESRLRFEKARQKPKRFDDKGELRGALLDFIADFANWDNSTVREFLDTCRALTHAAHEALGGASGTRPLLVDPFAGGGSIPLEALRVGAEAFGSDLNPVAVLLNKVLLEYIPRHGENLADEFRKWGVWIKEQADKELAHFYPKDADGATPIAYLWSRTIQCEGPGCGTEVPLIRSQWLAKKANRSVAFQLVPNQKAKRVDFQIIIKTKRGWINQDEAQDPKARTVEPTFEGTVKRGSVTCPCCGFTTPADRMRSQLSARRGGTKDARLICVVKTHDEESGRFYRLPSKADYVALANVKKELQRREEATTDPIAKVPNEPTPEGKGKGAGRAFSQRNYGMETFADVYTDRQALTLTTLARIIRDQAKSKMPQTVRILSAFALGRVNDLSMSLCRWLTSLEAIAAANGGQNRMPVVLDFVESNPFGGSGGDWLGQVDWIVRVVEHLQSSNLTPGTAARSPAQVASLPEDSADAMVTDPPYYDAFPYSDLSDFFFIWLKRSLGAELLDFRGELVPKDDEAVVYDVAHGGPEVKDSRFFQREMTRAFSSWRGVTKPSGIGVVVFANKTTQGWESLIQSIIDAGWIATASWPIDTERPNRQRAIGSAALGSSVHVVCRPREHVDGSIRADEIGDWRDVLGELPARIRSWMQRLLNEGVVGADAIFACLGPALEIFSRYSRVEKADGEQVFLSEFLEHVWATVSREALASIFEGADASGLEADARLTAMWLWTLNAGSTETANGDNDADEDSDEETDGSAKKAKATGFVLEYDAARKIAQGLGANLEVLRGLVEISADKARLLPVAERAHYLFGKNEGKVVTARKKKEPQMDLFKALQQGDDTSTSFSETRVERHGETVLDRIHQSMILFAAGRSEALKRFLVEDGVGRDQRFWRLAQALSALYPSHTEEKRWVDGVLARKKGLGF